MKSQKIGKLFLSLIKKNTIELVLIIMVLVASIIEPAFFTVKNIVNVLRQCSINGILAAGMTFIIINGNIDLSVAGVVGLAGMVCVSLQGSGLPGILAIIIALLIGLSVGCINGFFVHRGIAPYIMTMAMDTTLRGFAYLVTNGKPAYGIGDFHSFWGQGELFNLIPVPVCIWLLVSAAGIFVLNCTRTGRTVYAVGGNPEASRLSGMNILKSKITVYCISGALAALTGVVLTARLASCDPTTGVGYQTDAIAATVIGGTSMSGGEGKIQKTIIGVLIIGLLSNILNLIGISPYIQQVIKGLIIFGAVFTDNMKTRSSEQKHRLSISPNIAADAVINKTK